MATIIPSGYKATMNVVQTERAIKFTKDHFERCLAHRLGLHRITAPLFVTVDSGVQDNLNGVERPVSFDVPAAEGARCEIVQSLAKWKRLALYRYGFGVGEGIYTDMNALRPDEAVLDNLHSVYVDQWDWERVIAPEERNLDFLRGIVSRIYDVIRRTERYVCYQYPSIVPYLP